MNWKFNHNIIVVTGHFGSGKTELSINLAMNFKKEGKEVVLVDLDIINTYFRLREQEDMLKEHGIDVKSTGAKVSALDLPALDPSIEALIRSKDKTVIIDVGGNPSGARALGRYRYALDEVGYDQIFVVNANRPESSSVKEVIDFIERTQAQSQTFVTGLVNTSHLLKATTVEDVLKGQKLVEEVSRENGIPVLGAVIKEDLVNDLKKLNPSLNILPLGLYFRSNWMV